MFQQRLCKDENIIKVDTDNSFRYHVVEDVIHHRLEGCQAVHKAKEHDLWLKEPLVGAECSLPLVTFPNPDVVETPPDIQFVEVFGTLELRD